MENDPTYMNLIYNLANKTQIRLFGSLNPAIIKGFSNLFLVFIEILIGSSLVSSLKINVAPSSSLALIISCPKILQFYDSLIKEKNIVLGANEINLYNKYFLLFPINVRKCVSGEIYISVLSMYNFFFLTIEIY